MREPLCIAMLSAAALVLFSGGFAAGQRSAPADDRLVDQTLLATIDLATAADRLGDRELRLSRVNIAPRGHIGLHSHQDDPTVVYLLTGVITNHHDDGTTDEIRAGQAFAEFGAKSHWVENKGETPVTFVFASVSRRQ
jgi:quercetin dioxygenase-like cupin family protein